MRTAFELHGERVVDCTRRNQGVFLLSAATLLTTVAVGRCVGLIADGVVLDAVAPMGIELLAAAVMIGAALSMEAAADRGLQRSGAEQAVEADLEHLWSIVSDVATVSHWHPAVATADLLSESPRGLGAARRCNFHGGSNVREQVVVVDEGLRGRSGRCVGS